MIVILGLVILIAAVIIGVAVAPVADQESTSPASSHPS